MNKHIFRFLVVILITFFLRISTPTYGGMLNEIHKYLNISGSIEVEASYIDDEDIATHHKEQEWYLDFTPLELDLDISLPVEWITGKLEVKAEVPHEDDLVSIDEAYIKLKKEGFPLYFVFGKKDTPFGVFENHLISDTLPQELYEIDPLQITAGFRPCRWDLDASLTLYRGNDLIEKVYESGFVMENPARFFAVNSRGEEVEPLIDNHGHGNSFIFRTSLMPLEGLGLHLYYGLEKGDRYNNNSAGGAVSLNYWKLIMDAEVVFALQREGRSEFIGLAGVDRWQRVDDDFKERAWTATLAFHSTEALELAVRYEDFDHGADGEIDESLDWRASIGLNYNVWSHENLGLSLDAAVEYRYSEFEKGANENANHKTNEFFVHLGFYF